MNQSELLYTTLSIRQPAFLGFRLSTLPHEVCLGVPIALQGNASPGCGQLFFNTHIDLSITSVVIIY